MTYAAVLAATAAAIVLALGLFGVVILVNKISNRD